ncbi:MAG TPA: hypothetical protein VKG02_16175, partial [Blastocatellia bacterium]|nr:hypothetical protein [Blastocatellia bacterium]
MLPFFHYLLLFHTPLGMPVMNLRPSSGSAFFAKNRIRLPHSSHAPLIVKSRANEGWEFLLTPVEFFGFLLRQVCVKLHTPP